MVGIIYNNEPQQQALQDRATNAIKNLDIPQSIKDGLIEIFMKVKHPTNSKVALVVKQSGFYWDYLQDILTEAEKNQIVELGAEWFPQPEE